MPKYAARSDSNQQDIMDALRAAGASVVSLHRMGGGMPDLLVGYDGKNYLMEVKVGKAVLTPDEHKFITGWNVCIYIVRSVEDALRVIGRL